MPLDCAALMPDDDHFVQIDLGVWPMDNHKWALVAWERPRRRWTTRCCPSLS